MLTKKQLIESVLASFEAERTHDITKNNALLHDSFRVTDMVLGKGSVFPSLAGDKLQNMIKQAFQIKGREFIFQTIVADEVQQKVMVEFIESYPDKKSGKLYRTPQVAICIFKDGLLFRTRHYMDPRLSHEYLSQDAISKAME